jgi:DNA-binding response OmpR family regulator
MRVLVVEDEAKIARFISKGLQEEGYAVDIASDGEEAMSCAMSTTYDLILLDLMLPKLDGITVCRQLRDLNMAVSILVLTAMDSVKDRVVGLDAGADDYLVKPFDFEELLARIRALLRRPSALIPNQLQVDDLVLDLLSHKVERKGMTIELTSKEFSLLEYLMRNKGRALSRSEIREHAWGDESDGDHETNIVDVYISYLREKVDGGHVKQLIRTVRGVGYTLCEGP